MFRKSLGLAFGLALVEGSGVAWAACTPTAASNIDATCTGTTTNQNAPNGFGTGTENNVAVTVVPGATVTGTVNALHFNTYTVTNTGTISGNVGVQAPTSVTVTNNGLITGNSRGINAINASVTNFGTISATGTNGVGIALVSGTINNLGTISGGSVFPGGGIAVFGGPATIVNSGTVSGFQGITTTTNSGYTLINSGTIRGIDLGVITGNRASTVINSGTISGGEGIASLGPISVTNAGTVIGTNGPALDFGGPSTLTLLPGSTIIGPITFNGAAATVNFRGGNHNLTFDSLAGATVTGTTPFAASGNRAAAIDPTLFAMEGRALGDFTRTVSSAIPVFGGVPAGGGALALAAPAARSRIEEIFAGMPGLAYAGEDAVFKSPTVIHADGSAIWARGFGGQRVQQQDGVLFRAVDQFYGGMMGGDWNVRPDLRLGGFLGGGHTQTSIDLNAGSGTSDLAFGGVYGRYDIGVAFLHAGLQAGGSHNGATRTINNNLAPAGVETASASFNGWYVSPEATVGTRWSLGTLADARYTLTPSLRLRYLHGSYDGYSESGSSANLTVGSRTVSSVEERGEVKLTGAVSFSPANVMSASLSAGVLGVQRAGGDTINAALLGQAIPFATPGRADVWGGFGGAALEWTSHAVTVFAAAEYLALSDASSVVSGRAGLRVGF